MCIKYTYESYYQALRQRQFQFTVHPLIVQLLRSTDTNPQLVQKCMKAAILSVESQGLDNYLCDIVGRMR